jgi:hypothetical protein
MAHTVKLAAATANAAADAVAARCDGGTVNVWDGAQPATVDTATVTQTLLAVCPFSNPAFSSAAAGVAAAHAITTDDAAVAGGTAAWFRVLDSSGDPVMDGSVGVGTGFDCNVVSTTVVLGDPFAVASMTITAPES